MVAMTSFYAEKCYCHLVSEHEASAQYICSNIQQFLIHTTFVLCYLCTCSRWKLTSCTTASGSKLKQSCVTRSIRKWSWIDSRVPAVAELQLLSRFSVGDSATLRNCRKRSELIIVSEVLHKVIDHRGRVIWDFDNDHICCFGLYRENTEFSNKWRTKVSGTSHCSLQTPFSWPFSR